MTDISLHPEEPRESSEHRFTQQTPELRIQFEVPGGFEFGRRDQREIQKRGATKHWGRKGISACCWDDYSAKRTSWPSLVANLPLVGATTTQDWSIKLPWHSLLEYKYITFDKKINIHWLLWWVQRLEDGLVSKWIHDLLFSPNQPMAKSRPKSWIIK